MKQYMVKLDSVSPGPRDTELQKVQHKNIKDYNSANTDSAKNFRQYNKDIWTIHSFGQHDRWQL